MISLSPFPRRSRRGFSLIEVMVSIAVLSILLVLVLQMLNQMQITWKRTRHTVAEFKDARQGFDEMTRRLSQATLNSYWGYQYRERSFSGIGNIRYAQTIVPESELHFVSGPASVLFQGASSPSGGGRPGHAVFFQGPFGFCFTQDKDDRYRLQYEQLNGLLNAWGYFVEFNTDEADRPVFLQTMPNAPRVRARYRLMEFRQPSEFLQLYKLGLRGKTGGGQREYYRWFTEGDYGVNSKNNYLTTPSGGELFFRTVRPLAENIIGMILLPRFSDTGDPSADRQSLTPDYIYDTRRWQWGAANTPQARNSRHQLPPIIDITFIAVDEASFSNYAERKQIRTAADDPKLIQDGAFMNARDFQKDLDDLERRLLKEGLDYRVFTQSIRLRESKWTSE